MNRDYHHTLYPLSLREWEALHAAETSERAPANEATCGTMLDGFRCTLRYGHKDAHMAHGWRDNVCRVWTARDTLR